jgi:hypothetical protein
MHIFIGVGAMYRNVPHDTKTGVRRRPTETELAVRLMVRRGFIIALPAVMVIIMMMTVWLMVTVNMVSMPLMRKTHRWQGYATY